MLRKLININDVSVLNREGVLFRSIFVKLTIIRSEQTTLLMSGRIFGHVYILDPAAVLIVAIIMGAGNECATHIVVE
jgi:hypothetical protein